MGRRSSGGGQALMRAGYAESFEARNAAVTVICSEPPSRRQDDRTVAERASAVELGEEAAQIEGARIHGDLLPVVRSRPFLLRPVPVKLDSVLIRVCEVERLTHRVIRRAMQRDARLPQAPKCLGQCAAARIANCEMVEPGRSRRRRGTTLRLPRVQPDVMVVAARGDEGGLVADARLLLEAQHLDIERERAVDVGHLQMNMADVDAGIDAHEASSAKSRILAWALLAMNVRHTLRLPRAS